jgi:hypothetical protein
MDGIESTKLENGGSLPPGAATRSRHWNGGAPPKRARSGSNPDGSATPTTFGTACAPYAPKQSVRLAPSALVFPRWCSGSIPLFERGERGSTPRRGTLSASGLKAGRLFREQDISRVRFPGRRLRRVSSRGERLSYKQHQEGSSPSRGTDGKRCSGRAGAPDTRAALGPTPRLSTRHEWRNGQTLRSQTPVTPRSYWFDSSLVHHPGVVK